MAKVTGSMTPVKVSQPANEAAQTQKSPAGKVGSRSFAEVAQSAKAAGETPVRAETPTVAQQRLEGQGGIASDIPGGRPLQGGKASEVMTAAGRLGEQMLEGQSQRASLGTSSIGPDVNIARPGVPGVSTGQPGALPDLGGLTGQHGLGGLGTEEGGQRTLSDVAGSITPGMDSRVASESSTGAMIAKVAVGCVTGAITSSYGGPIGAGAGCVSGALSALASDAVQDEIGWHPIGDTIGTVSGYVSSNQPPSNPDGDPADAGVAPGGTSDQPTVTGQPDGGTPAGSETPSSQPSSQPSDTPEDTCAPPPDDYTPEDTSTPPADSEPTETEDDTPEGTGEDQTVNPDDESSYQHTPVTAEQLAEWRERRGFGGDAAEPGSRQTHLMSEVDPFSVMRSQTDPYSSYTGDETSSAGGGGTIDPSKAPPRPDQPVPDGGTDLPDGIVAPGDRYSDPRPHPGGLDQGGTGEGGGTEEP